MNQPDKNRLFISIILYTLLFIICWPFYKYVFDPDGIGYIGAAKQYAAGNFKLAVNGFWSPLHSWLIFPFIKLGFLPEYAFKYSNALISIASLYCLPILLNKFELPLRIKSSIQFISVFIFLHFTYYELAADNLLVLILLILFNLILSNNFFNSPGKNMLAGVIGAFAFFAKSYAFPFFLLYFILLHLLLNPNKNKQFYLITVGLFVFFLFSFPWIFALHWKYGEWMIAYGKNNLGNWDAAYRDASVPILIAPPYNNSPANWEDPWNVYKLNFKNAVISKVVIHQIRIILFNIQHWFFCIHEISFLAAGIFFALFVQFIKEQKREFLFIIITLLTLSSGYFLLHVETRFLWVLTFLFLIAGSILLNKLIAAGSLRNWQKSVIWIVFFGSFLLEPLNNLKDNLYKNRDLYVTSERLMKHAVKGRFTSNSHEGSAVIIAYLTGNSYYTITKHSYSSEELLKSFYENKIQYYFYFYNTQQQKEDFLTGKIASTSKELKELEPGLLILTLY